MIAYGISIRNQIMSTNEIKWHGSIFATRQVLSLASNAQSGWPINLLATGLMGSQYLRLITTDIHGSAGYQRMTSDLLVIRWYWTTLRIGVLSDNPFYQKWPRLTVLPRQLNDQPTSFVKAIQHHYKTYLVPKTDSFMVNQNWTYNRSWPRLNQISFRGNRHKMAVYIDRNPELSLTEHRLLDVNQYITQLAFHLMFERNSADSAWRLVTPLKFTNKRAIPWTKKAELLFVLK